MALSLKYDASDLEKDLLDFSREKVRKRTQFFDILLAQHLLNSINAEPLKKIRLICEAHMLLSKPECIMDIYKVAISLSQVDEKNRVPWVCPKTEETFKTLIEPWLGDYMPDFNFVNDLDKMIKLKKLYDENGNQFPKWKIFFKITSEYGVSDIGLNELKVNFIFYAMPKVMSLFSDIASKKVE